MCHAFCCQREAWEKGYVLIGIKEKSVPHFLLLGAGLGSVSCVQQYQLGTSSVTAGKYCMSYSCVKKTGLGRSRSFNCIRSRKQAEVGHSFCDKSRKHVIVRVNLTGPQSTLSVTIILVLTRLSTAAPVVLVK